jgi:thiol-disulfide isomerase/thioredoxin
MKKYLEKGLEKAISYQEYKDLVSRLISEGKSTGQNQTDELLNYSILNDKRMKRLDKTITLSQEIISKTMALEEPQTWLILTESWCGDAAQTIPIINKIANENSNINFKIVLRDENLELMDEFLTGGGRSIPKLVAMDKDNNVLNSWGPRPTIATKMVEDYKVENGSLDPQFKKILQVWYNKDKGKSVQNDFIKFLN